MEQADKSSGKIGAVLVVGGGIGGMQASLDLAEAGFFVYLVDSSPTIGGYMAQLDKTFPTNDCSMCIMSPKLVECGRHINIQVVSNSAVESVEGGPGNFKVTLTRRPRYIDEEKCTGCGECSKHCPVTVIDTYNVGLSRRSAIYIKYPQAVPKVFAVDREQCIGCGLCERVCLAKAVNYGDRERMETVEVGSIILSPGYEVFEAAMKPEFGYGVFDNVVTSIEFERLLSASGPFRGHLLRPSDGTIPEKIAFVQCVGSRDTTCGNDYCSSICCMYATKEAIIAKEHVGFVKPTIFYMDMRAYGKGFDLYYERARIEYGVRFIRCMISRIRERFKSKDLTVTYIDEAGEIREEEFNLVVLSVGMVPSRKVVELAKRIGVEVNRYGFCKTKSLNPLSTSRPGIYACGAFQSPKDIPETVAQASGAVACASGDVAEARGTLTVKKEYPEELDVRDGKPRIGVFVCHCGINIGGFVNVPEVMEYARSLPNVVFADQNLYTCSQDTQDRIKEAIQEHGLNRVVVASCSPRTHEPLFQETIREAQLNKFLFEMANIRDQCSWVHMRDKAIATEKAKDLVRMAVARARVIEPLTEQSLEVIQKGLVIGGGIAGMTAALKLAGQGFEVYLVEKEAELGGNLKNIYSTLEGEDVQSFLEETLARVRENPLIHVITDALVVDFSGSQGNFSTGLMVGPGMTYRKIEHGALILATGAEEAKPGEYFYGEDSRVMTQMEFEESMVKRPEEFAEKRHVVMIQCVGSRNEERPYCSRTCCSTAIKNALKLKDINPQTEVYILYRDIRTYGLSEEYYAKARSKGIRFVSYEPERKPQVKIDGNLLVVSFIDPILKKKTDISPDLLVLSSAAIPRENEELARLLKIQRTAENFFLEAHMKLRPVDLASDGMYVCGSVHAPKLISETISQASAAAARASTLLSKDRITVSGIVAWVDAEKCAACLTCVRVCPYEVPVINTKGEAEIDIAKCHGCGCCAAECPAKAIQLGHYRDDQVLAKCEAVFLSGVV
ncbi:MAG: FAD-dependent oxidoreductase [Proteobacteria bacterium]|nr:FAD-dependent oxidoreductase [Pseudomonadota bacterium]